MSLTLYGQGGRTFRCLWMLEEAQVPYQRVLINWAQGESHKAEYLQVNPNGKVPALVDNDMVLFESLAINFHLAKNYAPKLWVNNAEQESAAIQWLAWGMGELEGPHDAANGAQNQVDQARFLTSLTVLERKLSSQGYIIGKQFSVVDLNMACLLLRPQYKKTATQHPTLGPWLDRCTSRPSLSKAMSLVDG